jgi:hypothetical protein
MRLVFGAAIGASVLVMAARTSSPSPSLHVVGPPQIVFAWSHDACSADEIPDTPARAFRDASGNVEVLIAHQRTRRLVGASLDEVRPDCRVVFRSDDNPDPAAFDDREWLSSPWAVDHGQTIAALLHDEYQGNHHEGRCPSGSYRRCWYNAVTLAISRDGGLSYSHVPPPHQLVAELPSRYLPDAGPEGVFEPSNIVRNPGDGLLYVLVHVIGRNDTPDGTCVLRTSRPLVADSWRAWDGRRFDVRLGDPYHKPLGSSCQVVAQTQIAGMHQSVTYNVALRRFLLVGESSARDPRTGRLVTGIYYSLSDDLLTWSPRTLLLASALPWAGNCRRLPTLSYASALDPQSRSRNFDTTGSHFFLYVTRFNGGCKHTLNRDLIRFAVAVTP